MSWTNAAYREVAERIAERTGLVFPPSRHAEVESALRELVADPSDSRVVDNLFGESTEQREKLVARLTVGESYFFRDPSQFQLLRTRLLPELAEARSGAALRLWSAGCAAGEEPYSLAILCAELGIDAHVVGTDISRTRLAQARAASYRAWSLRGATPEFKDRWFVRAGNQYRLVPTIRDRVEFRHLNLAEDLFPSLAGGVWGMDLILCRNVLIYFDAPVVRRVAAGLIDSLSEDGWLLCGASDPPLRETVSCAVVSTEAGLAYRRPERGDAPASAWSWTPPVVTAEAREEPSAAPSERWSDERTDERVPAFGERMDVDLTAELEQAYGARDYAAIDTLAKRLRNGTDAGPRAWVLVVRALANRGCLGEAERAAAVALERHRDSAELLYLHGIVLNETGRYAAAAGSLRRALYVDPSLAVVHLAVADVRSRSGDVAGEKRALRNAALLLAKMPADAIVPASDGQRAGRLARLVRARLSLEGDAA